SLKMIIEVKNNEKQYIHLKFNDEWERMDFLQSLESLFRVHEVKIKDKIYNLQNNSIIIELNKNQTKLLKNDLEWIAFTEFNIHYYNIIINDIKEVNSKLKLSILK